MKKILIIAPVILDHENSCGTRKIIFNFIKDNFNEFSFITPITKINSPLETKIIYKYYSNNFFLYKHFNNFFPFNIFKKIINIKIINFLIREHNNYDIIHFFSYEFIPIVLGLNEEIKLKTIFSLIDSLPLYFSRRSNIETNILYSQINIFQSKKYFEIEKILIENKIPIHFVSKKDHDYFVDRHNLNKPSNVFVVENGVDIKKFFPNKSKIIDNKIIFFGNLFYKPNIIAVNFIDLLSKILNQYEFHVIGEINQKLNYDKSKIIFSGYVNHLNIEINQSSIAIFPIFFGSGIKNKILETFAVGTKVIATNYAVEGIPVPKKNCRIIYYNSEQYNDKSYQKSVFKWADEIESFSKIKYKQEPFVPYTWEGFRLNFNKLYSDIIN